MRSLLDTYPGPIRMLCVQFPDPHFKARHQKRHTVQREFCEDAAHILEKGGACPHADPILAVSSVHPAMCCAVQHCKRENAPEVFMRLQCVLMLFNNLAALAALGQQNTPSRT